MANDLFEVRVSQRPDKTRKTKLSTLRENLKLTEIDWENVKANLDRLTSEALIDIARFIRHELGSRKSKAETDLPDDYIWDAI